MSTLSAGDLTNLRTRIGRSSIYLSQLQPVTLLTALVDDATITRGARSIIFDTGTGSGFATIEEGQLLEVDTNDGLKWVRVKSISGTQAAGTVVVDENSIDWSDSAALRINHFYPIVAAPPTIRSGVFYKFFNRAYGGENLTPFPVVIMGSHRAGFLSSGSIAFILSASASYATAQGASISSYLWSCVHNGGGVGGVSFSSTTSATPTLTLTQAGSYWLKCTVTDSNGRAQSSFRAIFVYERGVTDPYKDFTVSGPSGDWQTGGYRFSVEATGDVELSDFPDRTLVVLWYDNTYNGASGYVDLWGTDAPNVICAGYLRKDQDDDELSPKGTGRVSFEVTTPEAVIDACSLLGSVSLNAVTGTPATWYQYASWMTVGRAIHHLLKWHSTVLETCDVYGLTTNVLGVENADFTEASLLQMINGLGFSRGHFAKLVSDRRGRLHFVTDSQMLNDAGRAALDTVFTLAVADISGVVDVVRQEEEVVSVVDLDGFYFSGSAATPWIAIAPGYIETISFNMPEFRGGGGLSIKNQVLGSTQTDSNEKAGRVLAQANNNPFEIRFTTPYDGIGAFDIVPSIGWYNWGIANSVLKRNTSLNGRLLICRHVDHQINHTAGTITTSVVFEPEALGPDGIAGNYPKSYPVPRMRRPSTSCTLAKGDIVAYETPGSEQSVCVLSATKAVAIRNGNAYVLDVSGTVITVGVVAAFDTSVDGTPAICAISSTKAIVAYRKSTDNFAHACVLDISGSTITPATPAIIDGTSNCSSFGIVALSATSIIAAYRQSAGTEGRAVVMTLSGSTITSTGTAAAFDTNDITGPVEIVALSATKALVSYKLGGAKACVLDISGTTVTPGTNQLITSGVHVGSPALVKLDSTTAYMAYQISTAEMEGIVLTISGTVITPGTAVDISSSGDSKPVACLFDNNRIIHYFVDAGVQSFVRTASISGTVVTANNDQAAFSGLDVSGYAMAQLTTDKVIVVERNQTTPFAAEAFIVSCL